MSSMSGTRGSEYDQIEEQPEHFNRSYHNATLMTSGPPAIYCLNTERKYLDKTEKKINWWKYGERDRKKQKVIMMVGETGTGKTTLINTMINHLLGVTFEDKKFYQITKEEDEDLLTTELTVYEVFVEENPTSLTIIDIPGYGNNEGYEKDGEISEYLGRLFSDEDGIHYIDAVCFVMKASQNRLSDKDFYIFHTVLSLFGRDMENNIVFLLTHSDEGYPRDALNAINTAEIPCRRDEDNEPVHFLFNNRQKEKRDEQYEHNYRSSWEMGERSMNQFFTLLAVNNRKNVQMTLDVLNERRQLEACVSNLKDQITEKELKMKELTENQLALEECREKIEKCKNFKFTVNRVVKEKVAIENEWWWNSYATCCSVCQENCHEWSCWFVNDLSWCEVMKNKHCTACTGKCHYSEHIKENQKYMMITKTVTLTFDELKQDFERTGDQNVTSFDRETYEDIKKELESNMKESENKIKEKEKLICYLEKVKMQPSNLLHEIYISIMILCKIAMKADSAFTLQHLDFLIPRLKEEGKDEWMKKLEDLRKTGEKQKNKGALRHVMKFGEVTGKKE